MASIYISLNFRSFELEKKILTLNFQQLYYLQKHKTPRFYQFKCVTINKDHNTVYLKCKIN